MVGRAEQVVEQIVGGEGLRQPLALQDAGEAIGGETRTLLHRGAAVEAEAEAGTEAGTLIDVYRPPEEVTLRLLQGAAGVDVRELVRGRPGEEDTIRWSRIALFRCPCPYIRCVPKAKCSMCGCSSCLIDPWFPE